MIKLKDLKKDQLYKITFHEEKYPGIYDNSPPYPTRIKILEGRGDYCIVLFKELSKHTGPEVPVWDIVASPFKIEGTPKLAWAMSDYFSEVLGKEVGITNIESMDKKDLLLYINDYTTPFYERLLEDL